MKIKTPIHYIFLILLFFSYHAFSKDIDQIDSLVLELEKETNDTIKVDLLLELASRTSGQILMHLKIIRSKHYPYHKRSTI